MLVSSFNLSQSFFYAPYLFCKKRFKSEINCFCIRTQYGVQKHIRKPLISVQFKPGFRRIEVEKWAKTFK